MSKSIIVCIADGTEEMEAIAVIDVARRAGITVVVAKVQPDATDGSADTSLQIVARSDTQLVADEHFSQLYKRSVESILDQFDMIVLPGGNKGAEAFANCASLVHVLKQFKRNSSKWIAAICAAPAVVLAPHGLLHGVKEATCFPKMHDKLPEHISAESKNEPVVHDSNVITSQGPGTAIAFALRIVDKLVGAEKARQVAQDLLVEY